MDDGGRCIGSITCGRAGVAALTANETFCALFRDAPTAIAALRVIAARAAASRPSARGA
jgi:hypothetical protein